MGTWLSSWNRAIHTCMQTCDLDNMCPNYNTHAHPGLRRRSPYMRSNKDLSLLHMCMRPKILCACTNCYTLRSAMCSTTQCYFASCKCCESRSTMRKTFGLCSVILKQAHVRASFAVQDVRNPQNESHKCSQKPLSAQALSSNCARRRRERASSLAAGHTLGIAARNEGGGCMLVLQRCQAGRVQAERRLNCAVGQGQQGRVCHLHSAACQMEPWCHRHRRTVSMPACRIQHNTPHIKERL